MNKEYLLKKLLEEHKAMHYFGSKSSFNLKNRNSDAVFNAYTLYKDDYGLLQKINTSFDFDLNNKEHIDSLIKVCNDFKNDIYIYREGTVHNQTFNGRVFPYDKYVIKLSYNQHSEEKVTYQINSNY